LQILITGGTGFIGVPLIRALLNRGDQVVLLARNSTKARRIFSENVMLVDSIAQVQHAIDVVINLAGEPIFDKRWTDARKQILLDSRLQITNEIADWIYHVEEKPKVFISGSAIGYYGNHPESQRLDEDAEPRECFSSYLCKKWEASAEKVNHPDVRVCTVRTGVVLAKNGGALKRMLMPYQLGLGGPMGSGDQWLSWIHMQDMINLLIFLIDTDAVKGPVNATAPNAVTHKTFAKLLANALKRPAFFSMPEVIVKILFGEAAELLVEGQNVYPEKLIAKGFDFRFSQLDSALRDIVNK
jgi:uncharacterized protein (TIGR01777 family)